MKAVVIRELRGRDRWLLASHLNPDGDAVGALIGLGLLLKEMGKEVTLLNPSGVPEIFGFLPESHLVAREVGPALDYDGLAILDSGDPERIGDLCERLGEFPLVVNIDHHTFKEPWGDLSWVDVGYGAVGEMVWALAPHLPAHITPAAAQNLYTAIMTDTGSFRYANTTPRTLIAAAELVEQGADPAECARRVYLTFSPGRLELLARVLATLELEDGGRVGFLSADKAVFKETGTTPVDLDGFVDYARGVAGVEVAAVLREEGGGHKLSLRSWGRVDVAALAARFGGGGHRLAAGMFFPGGLKEAKAAVLKEIRSLLDG